MINYILKQDYVHETYNEEREREQINKQIQRIGKKKRDRNRRKEIGKRRKEQEK